MYKFLKVNIVRVLILLIFITSRNFAGDVGTDKTKITGFIVDPQLSPLQNFISIERGSKRDRIIVFTDRQLTYVDEINLLKNKKTQTENDWDIFDFGEKSNKRLGYGSSFQLDWRPLLDTEGRQWFVFVSNGDKNQYDIYISYLDKEGHIGKIVQLTNDRYVNMYPRWSPDGQKIVFVSDRTGKGDLYLLHNINLDSNPVNMIKLHRLTNNPDEDNHPSWSPDGKYIAYSAIISENERNNSGINLIDVTAFEERIPIPLRLTTNSNEEETKPSWSRLNNDLIAFYTSRTGYKDNKINIGIVRLYKNVSNKVTYASAKLNGTPSPNLVYNVVPNENRGPSWMPISKSNSIVYIKRDESKFNPVHQASVKRWLDSQIPFDQQQPLVKAQMNREINAFATSNGYLMLFSKQLAEKGFVLTKEEKNITWELPNVSQEISKKKALLRAIIPGFAQYYKGEKKKGIIIAAAQATLLTGYFFYVNKNKKLVDELNALQFNYTNAGQKDADYWWSALNEKYDDAITARNVALIFGSAFMLGMVYNVYDAFQGFPKTFQRPVYSNNSELRFGISYNTYHSTPVFTTVFSFDLQEF